MEGACIFHAQKICRTDAVSAQWMRQVNDRRRPLNRHFSIGGRLIGYSSISARLVKGTSHAPVPPVTSRR